MTAPGNGEKEHGKHPTQKPVALVERCLLASTNEGDLVLDPFLGGGTTAVACVRLKRGCVGIELDFTHVALAAKRSEREIIEIVLRTLRVRIEVSVFSQNDLDLFSDSINGSRAMDDKPQVPFFCAPISRGGFLRRALGNKNAWKAFKSPAGGLLLHVGSGHGPPVGFGGAPGRQFFWEKSPEKGGENEPRGGKEIAPNSFVDYFSYRSARSDWKVSTCQLDSYKTISALGSTGD